MEFGDSESLSGRSGRHAYREGESAVRDEGMHYQGEHYAARAKVEPGGPTSFANGHGSYTEPQQKKKPSFFSRLLGVVGEILITIGVVIGLFIVWQVWYTDIEANQVQEQRVETITQEQFGGVVTVEDDGIGERQTSPPPEWSGEPAIGESLGIMRIPAFGNDFAYQIAYGTDMQSILDTGAFGQYEGTALPGEVGNFSSAAHRQTYGAPMRDVADLDIGDVFVVETKDAYLIYRMVDEEIVDPSAVRTVAPDPFAAREAEASGTEVTTEPTRRLLTITTCHPPFVSNERWVVHAELDHWVDRADGLPIELVAAEDVPDSYDGPAPLGPNNIGTSTIEGAN